MNKDLMRQFSELMTGPDIIEAFNQANKAHVVNYTAIFLGLVDKGIFTPEDWDKYKMLATHAVDQAWTSKLDEQNKEAQELLDQMEKDCPGVAKVFGFFLKRDEK